ncbi:unnamed protein product [marine sediment metagenome]|uniref:Uncharacterized protein n=1 Tax=marine sediment metagenome TaxID=412755 RepID=X0T3T5_9ZZZZ
MLLKTFVIKHNEYIKETTQKYIDQEVKVLQQSFTKPFSICECSDGNITAFSNDELDINVPVHGPIKKSKVLQREEVNFVVNKKVPLWIKLNIKPYPWAEVIIKKIKFNPNNIFLNCRSTNEWYYDYTMHHIYTEKGPGRTRLTWFVRYIYEKGYKPISLSERKRFGENVYWTPID